MEEKLIALNDLDKQKELIEKLLRELRDDILDTNK